MRRLMDEVPNDGSKGARELQGRSREMGRREILQRQVPSRLPSDYRTA